MPEEELDLDAIEKTLSLMPRIPRYPALFEDTRALVAEVRRLRDENERLKNRLNRLESATRQTPHSFNFVSAREAELQDFINDQD